MEEESYVIYDKETGDRIEVTRDNTHHGDLLNILIGEGHEAIWLGKKGLDELIEKLTIIQKNFIE